MEDNQKKGKMKHQGVSGSLFGLGWIGAVVYYLSQATGFWVGVWGIIKSLVWPAILVYKLFEHLAN